MTNLTKDQVRDLVGTFRTPCGVFFVNPSVINLDLAQCQQGLTRPRLAGTTAGVESLGFDQPTFPGQVFFNVAPQREHGAKLSHLPMKLNWDASIIKNIPITERVRFQLRAELFNVLNRANFAFTAANAQFVQANINATTFDDCWELPAGRPPRGAVRGQIETVVAAREEGCCQQHLKAQLQRGCAYFFGSNILDASGFTFLSG
jgi:hypothetical protein